MPTNDPRALELLIGKLPRPKKIAYRKIHSFSDDDLTYEKIEFFSESEPVRAYIVRPKNKPNHRLPVVYCHHQHNHQYFLGKREVIGRGGDSRQAYACVLAKRGYMTFAPDAKGFEERMIPGLQEEKGEVYEFARLLCQGKSLQWQLLTDIKNGISCISAIPDADSSKIGFIGHSLGGQEALFATAVDSRIKVAVSSCGFSTYKAIFQHKIPHNLGLFVPSFSNVHDLDFLFRFIAPRPFLILAGKLDGEFPYEGVVDVFRKARKIYGKGKFSENLKLLSFDTGHELTGDMLLEASRWFDRWLKP
jgi:dienelactone hydrolase